VGKLTLNAHTHDYHTEIEQAAFEPKYSLYPVSK